MSELVEFLRARLAEDEEVAASAGGGPWWVEDTSARRWGDERDAEVACSQGTVAVLAHDRSGAVNADHVARHDPARVLAEVEAKRRIVDRYAWLCEHGDTGGTAWVLPLLALPYASHPGYRQEWAP